MALTVAHYGPGVSREEEKNANPPTLTHQRLPHQPAQLRRLRLLPPGSDVAALHQGPQLLVLPQQPLQRVDQALVGSAGPLVGWGGG